jgi:hypothetical protein
MKKSISALAKLLIACPFAIAAGALPVMAQTSACCRQGWEVADLLASERLLDGICRGSAGDDDMIGYSCQGRQAVISALDKLGWCYGKNGQTGADMRWHRCTRDSQHTNVENLHTYDWDEKAHRYINQ